MSIFHTWDEVKHFPHMKSEVITCMGAANLHDYVWGMRKINKKMMWLTYMGSANLHNYNIMCISIITET